MDYFYIRVSDQSQNSIRQEVKAKELNIPVCNIYIDRMSGKTKDRPALNNLLAILKKDDRLIVDSISRFARNTKDLLELIDILNDKGVIFVSLKENIDTNDATGRFMLTVFGAVAELERDYIRSRQMEGIAIAKKDRSKYPGRKPIPYPKGWDQLYKKHADGVITASEMMKITQLKKTTFYKLLNIYKSK